MRSPEPVIVTEPGREEEKLQRKEEDSPVLPVQYKQEITHNSDEDSLALSRKPEGLHHSDVLQQSGRGPPESFGSFVYKLKSSKGSGIPLSGDTRRSMEASFDADLSGIRIHANATSDSLSRYIHAQAFTHGADIYFSAGKFAPETNGGAYLLAHEITHVLQQSGQPLTRKQHSHPVNGFTASETNITTQEANTSRLAVANNIPAGAPAPKVIPEKKAAPKPTQDVSPLKGKGKEAAPEEGEVAGPAIPRAPASPREDPAFQQARQQVRTEAVRQKKHDPARQKRTETEAASAIEETEQRDQSAREISTGEMEKKGAEQKAKGGQFDAKEFKEDLLARINQKQPESESEAKAFAQKPPLEHFEQDFSGKVATKQAEVTGPLEQQANTPPSGGTVEKPVGDLPKPVHSPAPKPVDPKMAIPKARTEEEISLQHESDRIDGAMDQARLSDEQLAQSREPSFEETLKAKQDAKQKIAEAPSVYRQQEAMVLEEAEAGAGKSLVTELTSMYKTNHKAGGNVFDGQKHTESETEKRQREIKEKIDGIYSATVSAVKCILECMASKVKEDFANSLKEQTNTFNENVRRRISDYYGDWRIDDKLFGPADVVVLPDGSTRSMTWEEALGRVKVKKINPDVYRIFVSEKNTFLEAMNMRLEAIAQNVQDGLTDAHNRIQQGRMEIALFKLTLKGEELIYAGQLEQEVEMKFETLEASINDTREDLLQTLADQYKEHIDQLETSFNDIYEELKKSWIDRAIDFIETVGRTIFQLADLLFSILVRVAYLVWDIINHPIRFFETLVSGLKQGIGMFIENIGTYMQEAFWTWITGATPVKNIRLSAASGIESLFDLVMQVLGLSPAELRAMVEKVMGREFMQMVDKGMEIGEKALEPVTILLTKGPLEFWEYLKESLAETIQSSFDRIRESVFNAFIEKALLWIAGFFIPGGGFVKIVKAIFKAFQFVAENLENIRHFFDSVFDSMESAIRGNTEGVANKIVTGLKMGVVLALDFLAKQLGLNKIVDAVQKIIQSLRKPIEKAIEWILRKLKPIAMKLMSLVQRGVDWTKAKVEQGKEWAKEKIRGEKEKPQAEQPAEPAPAGVDKNVDVSKPFSMNGEGHTLYLTYVNGRPKIEMASGRRALLRLLATNALNEIKDNTGVPWDDMKVKLRELLDKELDPLTEKLVSEEHSEEFKSATDYERALSNVTALLTYIGSQFHVKSLEFVLPATSQIKYGPQVDGFAGSMEVDVLTKDGPGGSAAANSLRSLGHMRALNNRVHGDGKYYVLGHLLNDNLHGPGNTFDNLTPITGSANGLHETQVESAVKRGIDNDRIFYYKVEPKYGRPFNSLRYNYFISIGDTVRAGIVRAEQYVPERLVCNVKELQMDGQPLPGGLVINNHPIPVNIDQSPNAYEL